MEYPNSEFDEILETQVGNDPKSENCKISSVIQDRNDYNLNLNIKEEVWEDNARSELIKSILQNVCIHLLLLAKMKTVYI